ncbi:aminotransferase class I/II-fold pyridoxal phosphate-dependent enzyme [Actinomadura rugatobispora]|uniref:Aminotransferase class I/II-fold pyridoxal phosphate-dependent enzyme n=1 Tax=Actinomadura rugatobispora TaxID=1994 RepID=A0ABW1ADS3_9ACTN|nr:hypothetical protein GCM10010200_021560 [Actinomadura rugatobispora]
MNPVLRGFVAERERRNAADIAGFGRTGLRPRGAGRPAGIGPPDPATKILGRTWAAPLAVAPLAGPDLACPNGEPAMVRAAAAAGVPVVVSAYTGRTFAELAATADTTCWLRLPPYKDRAVTRRLVERAERAGFEALMVAADVPCLTVAAAPAHLAGPSDAHGDPADPVEVEWLRSACSLPVFVAGPLSAADASRAVDAGAAGIVVTGRPGGRGAIDVLPEVAAAVAGRCPVLLDGGVRGGADVLIALAAGADAVCLGRPVLDGLAADGESGAARVLDVVVTELKEAMTFTGAGSVADIGPGLVRTQPGPVASDPPGSGPVEPAPRPAGADLRKRELHGSVSSPVLDTMTFLNEITLRYPDAISFAPGRPYDDLFQNEQIFGYLRRYLDHLAAQGRSPHALRTNLFQYGPTAGQIQDVIADSLRIDEDIDVPPESIVVTVGAQEAMLLVLRALIAGPDDVLLVSSPCYVGITGAARLLDIAVTGVEERAGGVSCADLEAAILAERARGRRPRAFYVVPDHSNPSGTTMDLRSRRELLAVAARHDILVLEDNPYRLVSPGPPPPTLKSLDRERRVVHLGSYSKTVFPGARVGFVIADQRVEDETGRTGLLADELAKIKSMVTVNTSSLSQAAVAGALLSAGGRLSEFNAPAAAHYAGTMRATLEHLDRRLPAGRRAALGVRWNKPAGGFFLTVEVPFRTGNAALNRSAQEFGVIWTPMTYFHPEGGGHHALRLSTSYLTSAEIEEGTARLAHFIEAQSNEAQA